MRVMKLSKSYHFLVGTKVLFIELAKGNLITFVIKWYFSLEDSRRGSTTLSEEVVAHFVEVSNQTVEVVDP